MTVLLSRHPEHVRAMFIMGSGVKGYIRGREDPKARAFICGANILSFKIVIDFKVH